MKFQKPLDFWLIVILCLGAILRLLHLTSRSLWLDEATSLYVAAKSIPDILAGIGFDRHTPPGYYVLLAAWLRVFPHNEFGLRFFSVLFDLANIALMFSIFSRQFGRAQGMLSAALYAISPFAVYYAQEGRMYSLLLFLVLCTYALALRVRSSELSKRGYVLLFVICVTGMYTHYYYALSLLAITLGLTCSLPLKSRSLAVWWGVMVLVGIAFIPWIQIVLTLAASGGQEFRRFTTAMLPYTAFRFTAGYGIFPLHVGLKDSLFEAFAANLYVVAGFALIFSLLVPLSAIRLFRERPAEVPLFVTPLLLVPILAYSISLRTPMLSERYLIVIYPFFVSMIAFGMLSVTNAAGRFLSVGATVLLLYGLAMHHGNPAFGNTQWRDAAAYIADSSSEATEVYVQPGYADDLLRFYLPAPFVVYPVSPFAESFPPRNKAMFWLVVQGGDPKIRDTLERSGLLLGDEQLFPLENGIRVFLFERPLA